MPFTTYSKNLMLAALPNTVYVSLHTVGSPAAAPTQGTPNEVTGGTYARVSMVVPAASNGVRTVTAVPITLNVPANTTVAYVGYWDASTAGNLLEYYDITDEAFVGAGKADINAATFSIVDSGG